ncbi:alpha/beta fold hydrolase [Pseudoruegeria sp. HB172150]|uniref:alpha/beta fold hydrolase n=1 Tax=Pseudoruegeria sp. HB172150 TaxID=2721164 RepID=UPI001553988C|nr:alpha/beta fold hydrolase [Pseudoruegeria sp. HB172150]
MNYDQIIATVAGLLASEPGAGGFPELVAGGFDPAYPVEISPCARPLLTEEIEGQTVICGTISVPEDHEAPEGRRIDLAFTVLKSHSDYPSPDPLVHLHGGPGGGIMGNFAGFAQVFDPFRQTRDLVMFDQRAAGLSGASTSCFEAMRAHIDVMVDPEFEGYGTAPIEDGPGLTAQCTAELKAMDIDLSKYNTLENARDVRAVLTGLGYDTYNLYGISYGTKLSLEVMRSVPEGLRAVVIDGVAPPAVKLYDTVAQPVDEAIQMVVDLCAADDACDAAYPDLGSVITGVLEAAAAGELEVGGEPLPLEVALLPFMVRNGSFRKESITPVIPALMYELTEDKTPLWDKIKVEGFDLDSLSNIRSEKVKAQVKELEGDPLRAAETVMAEADLFRAAEVALRQSLEDLRLAVLRDRDLGPLGALFDRELQRSGGEWQTDRDAALAAARDYLALQNGPHNKVRLAAFVAKHFEDEERLLALIEAMNEAEVEQVYRVIAKAADRPEHEYLKTLHLGVYACQEDLPYNTMDGFEEATAAGNFPAVRGIWAEEIGIFFEMCKSFDQSPREGFQDPVVSDIPTLSIGSGWDTQTAASWAELAVETLPNGQSIIIPEAGHGAIAYQPCVQDMSVAFINDPTMKIDDRCRLAAMPEFWIRPAPETAAEPEDAVTE